MSIVKTYSISSDLSSGYDSQKLYDEIVAGNYVAGFDGFNINGDVLKILGDTLTDGPGMDTALSNHVKVSFQEYKQVRYDAIDTKTKSLIAAGFVYDNETFSLSHDAQSNWAALKNNSGDFTWDKNISTINNNTYSLALANLVAFWTACNNAINGHLDSGRVLKKSVFDAANEAAVDVVTDVR